LTRRLFKLRANAFADDDLVYQRVALGPELFRQRLVNDHDRRSRGIITQRESPSPHEGNLEDVEVAGRDSCPADATVIRPIRQRPAHNGEGQTESAFERQAA